MHARVHGVYWASLKQMVYFQRLGPCPGDDALVLGPSARMSAA